MNMTVTRRGATRWLVIFVIAVCIPIVGAVVWMRGSGQNQDLVASAITVPVLRQEFIASVSESGDVESANNVEIRCRVKTQGRSGTMILSIVPEGTKVQPGDLICQLDDSLLVEQQIERNLVVAKDRAALIQAEMNLNTAKFALQEYQEGTSQQEVDNMRVVVALAEETLRRSQQYLAHSERLSHKGFITRTQLEADAFAVEKANLELRLAEQKLQVYEKITQIKLQSELQAAVDKQQANLEAVKFTLALSEQRKKEIEGQIAACRIVAPSAGTVVYANNVDRRSESSFVIEEGAMVRDGQPIVYLPDIERMQVRAAVNDSKINRVKIGQSVQVWLDSSPDKPYQGEVSQVAPMPLPRRWFQAPIEYEVLVAIQGADTTVRPGLRAKVDILVESMSDVCQAPMASVVKQQEQYYVLVKKNQRIEPRAVTIGSNNDKYVVITDGIADGEEVLVDPENYRDAVEFPAL